MALIIVSVLRPSRLASLLPLFLLVSFLQLLTQGQVLRQDHNMFLRSKRSNSFLEELWQGNLERECFEEQCNFEEARECFENDEKTNRFWTIYLDGDQCNPNPCLHGGNCTDKVGGFSCSCPAPYYGPVCELETAPKRENQWNDTSSPNIPRELVKCPTEGPTACQQLCTASRYTFTCSCTAGFRLHSDERSCLPEVEFPCGQIPERFSTSSSMCRHGRCPWQVSVMNSEGIELCAGVLLGGRTVLTAASCLHTATGYIIGTDHLSVVAGDEENYPVRSMYIHNQFRLDRDDHDLALLLLSKPAIFSTATIPLCLPTKDFSENILMRSGKKGVADKGRSRRNHELVYMTLDSCRSELNVSQSLSNKMFCMKRQAATLQPPALGRRSQHHPTVDRNDTHRRWSNQTIINGGQGLQRNVALSRMENQGMLVSGTILRSNGGGRSCSGPLPGSPVATVEQGTAFLTGVLLSTPSSCDGLVFTKLSRYLNWIRPRLEAAEGRTTPNN